MFRMFFNDFTDTCSWVLTLTSECKPLLPVRDFLIDAAALTLLRDSVETESASSVFLGAAGWTFVFPLFPSRAKVCAAEEISGWTNAFPLLSLGVTFEEFLV